MHRARVISVLLFMLLGCFNRTCSKARTRILAEGQLPASRAKNKVGGA
jgi:hypothetical protein